MSWPLTTSWTALVSAKPFLGVSFTTSPTNDADFSLSTTAFLAVNEPFLPAVASWYAATLSASAAFTGPLKSTMISVTTCLWFCTN